jgi:hypothetical protein
VPEQVGSEHVELGHAGGQRHEVATVVADAVQADDARRAWITQVWRCSLELSPAARQARLSHLAGVARRPS